MTKMNTSGMTLEDDPAVSEGLNSGRVAWVGWEGSDRDWKRFSEICRFIPQDSHDDIINLKNGRDFLEENEQYQIVIICYIYSDATPYEDLRKIEKRFGNGKWWVSNLSIPENWRKRLLQTQAETIIACGSFSEVGHAYLGDLPGYLVTVTPDYSRWNLENIM